jgi:hypothetical protein
MNIENVNKFCSKALSISESDPLRAGAVGFLVKFLVQTTLPHKDPGDVDNWGRSNGKFSLVLQSGVVSDKNGNTARIGLPYGNIPRLILPWLTTEAIKTKSREIDLDCSLSSFMKKIGFSYVTGGKSGSVARFREQLYRLLSASIFLHEGNVFDLNDCVVSGARLQVASRYHISWAQRRQKKEDSYVILDQEFFDRVIDRPVPVDLRVIKMLMDSPLSLDLYSLLTYRFSYLSKKTLIPWRELMKQLGSEFSDSPQGLQGFKRTTARSLNKINAFWGIKVDLTKDFVVLYPQDTHVKKALKV